MKILELRSENVKTLKAITIRPTSDVVTVLGDNGAGKTSTLDSIIYAFGGKGALPAEPVRRGEDVATIELELDGLRIERVIRSDRTTAVKVISADGALYPTPETMLKSLFGEYAFDPFAFYTSKPKDQLETLRSLVKLDTDLDEIDRLNARDMEIRKGWNAKAESLKARVADLRKNINRSIDTKPLDIEALTKRMEEASEKNLEFTTRRHELAQLVDARGKLTDKARECREQAELLMKRAQELDDRAIGVQAQIDATTAIPDNVDVSELREQLNAAMRENAERDAEARARAAYDKLSAELKDASETSKQMTETMAARVQQKRDAIAAAKMPIEGLGFGAEGVLYNDLPLEQASAAERLRVAFAIAMAMNPRVRVVLIRDGSLLDRKNMALIEEMAAEHDFQVWVERVGDGPCGILIEDGEVAAIDGIRVHEGEAVGANG